MIGRQSSQSSRRGRFAHQLLSEEECRILLPRARQILNPFLQLWHEGDLSSTELCASYILIVNGLRRPRDFLGGALIHPQTKAKSVEASLIGRFSMKVWFDLLSDQFGGKSILLRKFLSIRPSPCPNNLGFLDFFCDHNHRSIPSSVNRVLAAWGRGTFPLKLLFHIPSPAEVLEMQIQSARCVTMLLDFGGQDYFNNGRDPLSFILHDLIHADRFFSNEILVVGQTHFLCLIHENIQNGDFAALLNDPVFKVEFEYLIADMNSHPFHLLKTLIAIVQMALTRRGEREQLRGFFEKLISHWSLSVSVSDDLLNLCSVKSTLHTDGSGDSSVHANSELAAIKISEFFAGTQGK